MCAQAGLSWESGFQVCRPVHRHAVPAADMSLRVTCCRLGSGAFVSGKLADFKKRPKEPIILYEFDGCPFCRKVCACIILLPHHA